MAAKKLSTPRRCTKPKTAAEKQVRCRKPKSPDREKTRKWVKLSSIKKKHRVYERDPWAWGKNLITYKIQKWGESELSPKKRKTQNVEKYFDDVPKKKMKVSRLMKFMDRNREFVQVDDNFELLIGNRPIPGLDFIKIMNYLQKRWKAKEHTFIPSRDP